MTIPARKVEIGFDLTNSPIAPFFVLDDPVRGVLDNPNYVLAGTIFYDVTSKVRNINISRGRNADFDVFPAGQASVDLNNHDRAFDPLYADSPFYGNIIPRREIRISAGTAVQFTGSIDDWNLQYTPDGDSTVTAIANDALGNLAGQIVTSGTQAVELSGARIESILDDPNINWPLTLRDIDPGASLLQADVVADNTNALNYLQTVATSDPGNVYIGKTGNFVYRDRTLQFSSENIVNIGGTAGVPFQNLAVVYGSELLYNQISISRQNGGTAIAVDLASQSAYGIRTLALENLLLNSDDQLTDIALVYAARYSTPEYRVESAEIQLDRISTAQQNLILGLELGDVIRFEFTPNEIPPAIVQYLEVIRIEHNVTPLNHYVTLGFQALIYAPFILDDPVFGKLDSGTLSW